MASGMVKEMFDKPQQNSLVAANRLENHVAYKQVGETDVLDELYRYFQEMPFDTLIKDESILRNMLISTDTYFKDIKVQVSIPKG